MASVKLVDAQEFSEKVTNMSLSTWRLLDGKDVEIFGEWLKDKNPNFDDDSLGCLSGPYVIMVHGKHGDKLGEILIIEDKNAISKH